MKKTLQLSAIALIAAFTLAGCASGNSASKDSSSKSASSKKVVKKATWTQADVDNLKVGDLANKGAGGDTYKSIEAKYGKPATKSSTTVSGMSALVAGWTNTKGDLGSSVALSFVKTDNGQWLLYSKGSTNVK